jgi:hypothetical protein
MHIHPFYIFMGLGITAVLLHGAVILTNIRSTVAGRAKRAALLAAVMKNPATFAHVWYESSGPDERNLVLQGRYSDGRVVLLATAREAPSAWSKLQQVGVLVHSAP